MRTPASSSAIRSTSSITEQQPLQRSRRPRQPAPSTIRKPITTRKPRPPPRARWSSHSLFQAVPPTTHALRSAPGRPARCKLALTPSTRIVANLTPASQPGSTQWTQLNQTWSTSTTPTCSTRCSPRTIQATNNSLLRNSINLNKSLEPRTYGKAHRVLWQITLHQLSVARANKTNNSSRWLIRCCGSSRCI